MLHQSFPFMNARVVLSAKNIDTIFGACLFAKVTVQLAALFILVHYILFIFRTYIHA